jgi:hypothetical protein
VQCGGCGGERITSANTRRSRAGRTRVALLNTSCDQQAGLCVDAGMGAELGLRVYRLAAHCRKREGSESQEAAEAGARNLSRSLVLLTRLAEE